MFGKISPEIHTSCSHSHCLFCRSLSSLLLSFHLSLLLVSPPQTLPAPLIPKSLRWCPLSTFMVFGLHLEGFPLCLDYSVNRAKYGKHIYFEIIKNFGFFFVGKHCMICISTMIPSEGQHNQWLLIMQGFHMPCWRVWITNLSIVVVLLVCFVFCFWTKIFNWKKFRQCIWWNSMVLLWAFWLCFALFFGILFSYWSFACFDFHFSLLHF